MRLNKWAKLRKFFKWFQSESNCWSKHKSRFGALSRSAHQVNEKGKIEGEKERKIKIKFSNIINNCENISTVRVSVIILLCLHRVSIDKLSSQWFSNSGGLEKVYMDWKTKSVVDYRLIRRTIAFFQHTQKTESGTQAKNRGNNWLVFCFFIVCLTTIFHQLSNGRHVNSRACRECVHIFFFLPQFFSFRWLSILMFDRDMLRLRTNCLNFQSNTFPFVAFPTCPWLAYEEIEIGWPMAAAKKRKAKIFFLLGDICESAMDSDWRGKVLLFSLKIETSFSYIFCWLAAVYMKSCVIQTQIASLFSLTSVDYMYVICGKVNIFPIRRHEENVDSEGKKVPHWKMSSFCVR